MNRVSLQALPQGRPGKTCRSRDSSLIRSEHELQSQLRGPRSADLIERIEAAVLAAASERGSQHLRRLPELRRAQIVDGASEIGVVEDVEKIRARLKSKPLAEFELPAQRQIDIRCVESAQGISSQISLHRAGWVCVNAAGLISLPPATFGFAIQSGTPETRFGRCTPEAPDK